MLYRLRQEGKANDSGKYKWVRIGFKHNDHMVVLIEQITSGKLTPWLDTMKLKNSEQNIASRQPKFQQVFV